jgi:hypothetical protein
MRNGTRIATFAHQRLVPAQHVQMSVEQVFRKVQSALDEAGVPYMITGSFASSVYGEPRASKDIDVVIAPTREIIDYEFGWRIDFIFRKDRPFGIEEFGRRRAINLSGLTLFVASPEDQQVDHERQRLFAT